MAESAPFPTPSPEVQVKIAQQLTDGMEKISYNREGIDTLIRLLDIVVGIDSRFDERGNNAAMYTDVTLRWREWSVTWTHREEDPWDQHGGPVELWSANIHQLLSYATSEITKRGLNAK